MYNHKPLVMRALASDPLSQRFTKPTLEGKDDPFL